MSAVMERGSFRRGRERGPRPNNRPLGRPRTPDLVSLDLAPREYGHVQLECIDDVSLLVRDVERSVRCYEEVLGLQGLYQEVWGSFPAVVGVGGTSLALFPVTSPTPHPPPERDTICVRHIAFRVDQLNFLATPAPGDSFSLPGP